MYSKHAHTCTYIHTYTCIIYVSQSSFRSIHSIPTVFYLVSLPFTVQQTAVTVLFGTTYCTTGFYHKHAKHGKYTASLNIMK